MVFLETPRLFSVAVFCVETGLYETFVGKLLTHLTANKIDKKPPDIAQEVNLSRFIVCAQMTEGFFFSENSLFFAHFASFSACHFKSEPLTDLSKKRLRKTSMPF